MNLGMPEMIFIFLLALVIFGPRKLPELGRQLGKALAEFKKASNEFKNQLEVEARANKQPDTSPKILPAEKLFDTVNVSPAESIPRGPLPTVIEPELADPAIPTDAGMARRTDSQSVTPDIPSHNV